MIRDLGRVLSEAIYDSSDASRALEEIHGEGYSLYLTIGATCEGRSNGGRNPSDHRRLPVPRNGDGKSEPEFRIDSRDLSFLRSVGIDPTRRRRRRRRD